MQRPGACRIVKHSGRPEWASYTRCEGRPVPIRRASGMGVLLLLWGRVPAIRAEVVLWLLVAFCWFCGCNDASIRDLVASFRCLSLEQGWCLPILYLANAFMVWNMFTHLHLLVKLGTADYIALPSAHNWSMAYSHRTRQ
jgi:hypothetical protein